MDKHCRICHNTSCSNHSKNISFLGDGWKCNYIPAPTNADRIRAMSDEGLAKHLVDIGWDCHLCAEHRRLDNEPLMRGEKCDEKCAEHCLEWLQQPPKGE